MQRYFNFEPSFNLFTHRGHSCPMSLNACNPESISYFVLISIYIEKASANYHFTWKFNCFLFSYISALLHIGYFLDLRIFNSSNINFQGLQLGKLSYVFIDSLSCYIPSINFKDFLSHRKEFILISIRCDTDVPQGGNGNFSRKKSIF